MKTYKIIRTILYTIIGILTIIFYEHLVEFLPYVIGGVMASYGLEFMLECAIAKKAPWKKHFFIDACIEIIFGLYIIFFVNEHFVGDENTAMTVICVLWGVWAILREGREITEVIERAKEKLWMPFSINLIESGVVIALSLMLILKPSHHHALTHIIILGIELILFVWFPIMDDVFKKIKEKNHHKVEE